jgi:hypothetical protein
MRWIAPPPRECGRPARAAPAPQDAAAARMEFQSAAAGAGSS